MTESFRIKDCALAEIATGSRAQNLRELRDNLEHIDTDSIYYHFWGALLRPRFINREFNNDFAEWARRGLRDYRLSERIAVLDPTAYPETEQLRRELIELIEERLEESEHVPWARKDEQFHFRRSKIVVFDTGIELSRPEQLVEAVPAMSLGSVFYHFIDARRREPRGQNDFQAWLGGCGEAYHGLCLQLGSIDPFFQSLPELRRQLSDGFRNWFGSAHS